MNARRAREKSSNWCAGADDKLRTARVSGRLAIRSAGPWRRIPIEGSDRQTDRGHDGKSLRPPEARTQQHVKVMARLRKRS